MAKAKKRAKRYTAEQKQEVLDYIVKEGRGGQTRAVAKFGVTAATIASWKRKSGMPVNSRGGRSAGAGGSKELRAVEELAGLLKDIATTEAKLAKLKKAYKKAKSKL